MSTSLCMLGCHSNSFIVEFLCCYGNLMMLYDILHRLWGSGETVWRFQWCRSQECLHMYRSRYVISSLLSSLISGTCPSSHSHPLMLRLIASHSYHITHTLTHISLYSLATLTSPHTHPTNTHPHTHIPHTLILHSFTFTYTHPHANTHAHTHTYKHTHAHTHKIVQWLGRWTVYIWCHPLYNFNAHTYYPM